MSEYVNSGVDHPSHYQKNGREAIDYIERFSLNFSMGSIVKYLWRAGEKAGESLDKDKEKALWYYKREVNRIFNMGYGNKTWQEAKDVVCSKLICVFGPPEKNRATGEVNWNKGGADIPEALDFIKNLTETVMQD